MKSIFAIILLVQRSNGAFDSFMVPSYGSALTRAVADIILNYYLNETNTINLYHASLDDAAMVTNHDIMNEIIHHVKSHTVVQLENVLAVQRSHRKRSHNIIYIDSYKAFAQILDKMDPANFVYQGFYLIVVTQHNDELYHMVHQIFGELWSRQIVNINIIWMAPENENDAIMYTYYPYTPLYCGEVFPIQLNQFHDDKWLHPVDYFPNKMLSLHGCPLKVSTFPNPPFMVMSEKNDGIHLTGLDGFLLRALAERMHFSVLLFMNDERWGDIFVNGSDVSSTGAMHMVINQEVNFAIGSFTSTVLRDTYMAPSYVYYTSNLVWIIPPGKTLSPLQKLIRPFKDVMWIIVVLILCVSFLVVAFLKLADKKYQNFLYGRGIQNPCLNIVNVSFGGAMHRLPVRNFARTVLGIFMLYCLVVRSSYQGALFKFMQMELYEPQVSSTEEMIENDFRFYMLKQSGTFVDEMPEVKKRAHFVSLATYGDMLDELMNSDFKGAFLSSEDHIAFRNIKAFPEKHYWHAPEYLFSMHMVIYMPKESCLPHQINEIIMRLTSAGLIHYWASFLLENNNLRGFENNRATTIGIEQIKGPFELLAIGLGISFIVFILEHVSMKLQTLHRVFKEI
uniref:Ionotropic receptor 4 n=1 Tax=Propsilocerus akamusi TaxID=903466 RepID=A0A7D0P9Q1_9DIPT|nr:ionotropic receptor 4 [Propsilocerus akamusi]